MFKEIETELLSILSDDPIEKIAHMPSREIAKTMDLLYNIKFEDIQKVYTEDMGMIHRMTVIYNSNDNSVDQDICPINGKVYHITLIPSSLLVKAEDNIVYFLRSIITYISARVEMILDNYRDIMDRVDNNILNLTILQAVPVITCAVVRKFYSGPSLAKIVYIALTEVIEVYKTLYTEEGVNSVLNLFDEGLGVSELLDSGFICSIPVDDANYPGIWNSRKEENK